MANESETAATPKCDHARSIPIQVDSEEGGWIHWCSTCGAMSSESSDIDQPKGPWFSPGDLSEEDVLRINRAAQGE